MKFGDVDIDGENKVPLHGTVVFLNVAAGSKSESLQPFLYKNSETIVRIHLNTDDSFDNEQLKPFDGKNVMIEGTIGREGIFEISEICESNREKV